MTVSPRRCHISSCCKDDQVFVHTISDARCVFDMAVSKTSHLLHHKPHFCITGRVRPFVKEILWKNNAQLVTSVDTFWTDHSLNNRVYVQRD